MRSNRKELVDRVLKSLINILSRDLSTHLLSHLLKRSQGSGIVLGMQVDRTECFRHSEYHLEDEMGDIQTMRNGNRD